MAYTYVVGEDGNIAKVNSDGKLEVVTAAELTLESIETEIQGTISVADSRDLRGLLGDRPAAAVANRGYTYWAVDELGTANELTVSNGTTWEAF